MFLFHFITNLPTNNTMSKYLFEVFRTNNKITFTEATASLFTDFAHLQNLSIEFIVAKTYSEKIFKRNFSNIQGQYSGKVSVQK